jgi:hypothetical protein
MTGKSSLIHASSNKVVQCHIAKLLTNNNTIASGSQSASDLQTNSGISTSNDASEASHVSCVFNSLIHL